jgi:hypothetical protein
MFNSLAEYPHWFVILCVALASALGLWLVVKLVEVSLWILFVGAVIAAVAAAFFFLFN